MFSSTASVMFCSLLSHFVMLCSGLMLALQLCVLFHCVLFCSTSVVLYLCCIVLRSFQRSCVPLCTVVFFFILRCTLFYSPVFSSALISSLLVRGVGVNMVASQATDVGFLNAQAGRFLKRKSHTVICLVTCDG